MDKLHANGLANNKQTETSIASDYYQVQLTLLSQSYLFINAPSAYSGHQAKTLIF